MIRGQQSDLFCTTYPGEARGVTPPLLWSAWPLNIPFLRLPSPKITREFFRILCYPRKPRSCHLHSLKGRKLWWWWWETLSLCCIEMCGKFWDPKTRPPHVNFPWGTSTLLSIIVVPLLNLGNFCKFKFLALLDFCRCEIFDRGISDRFHLFQHTISSITWSLILQHPVKYNREWRKTQWNTKLGGTEQSGNDVNSPGFPNNTDVF